MGVAATLLGGAAMTGAAGIGSSIMTNNANKDIAQNNNAFNEKILQKQMDYNKEMYQMQLGDTYRLMEDQASLQARGFEKAGFNPGVMMSGNLGSVSSPTAQGINPPSASPYIADYSGIGQSIGSAIDMYTRMKNASSERANIDASTANLRIEGQYKAAEAIASLAKMKAETKSIGVKTDIDKLIKTFMPRQQEASLGLMNSQIQQALENAKLSAAERLMTNEQLKWMPLSQKASLAESAARISLMRAQGKLTSRQAEHEVQKIAETEARTFLTASQERKTTAETSLVHMQQTGQMQENQFNADTYKYRVNLIREELLKLIYDTDKLGIGYTIGRGLDSFGVDMLR